MKTQNKYIAKKQSDDGYYWMILDRKTRAIVRQHLSKFDATGYRDSMNAKAARES